MSVIVSVSVTLLAYEDTAGYGAGFFDAPTTPAQLGFCCKSAAVKVVGVGAVGSVPL